MAAFSLNATKNLVGGEGGLLVTNSEELRGKANMVRMFGEFFKPGEGRSYKAYTMGWMYRTQEMPAALARSQLKRLDEYNENSRRNGGYLTKELSKIKGIRPPITAPDRTHIYHKYRIRLEPEELGLDIGPIKFRDKIKDALNAEGVDAVLWQTFPLPANPLFQEKKGYGKGCPWECPHSRKVVYNVEDYPETQKLCDSSLVICSELYAIFCQKMELMKYYVEAFHKVFNNLDRVIEGVN